MAASIVIPYGPRRVFVPYHLRKERWAALVAHRRCGKTVACVNDLIARALARNRAGPPPKYAYVAPYLAQAKEVAWSYLTSFAQPAMRDKNESELWVELANGARIRIHGADNPDRLRGAYLDGVVLDEYADMRPTVWGEVIRPMLTDYQGWATFIGTPKGRNSFYEVVERAKESPEWFSAVLRASETGILPRAELDDARADMTPEQYEQEFECSFDAAIVGAYYGKEVAQAEREGRITDVPHDPNLPVYTAWDLGISTGGNTMSIWFWQMNGPDVNIIDFYGNHSQGLDHYFAVLADKPYQYADDWLPPDARAKELTSGRTRVEHFAKSRRLPRVLPQHTIADRINAGRLLFPRVRFDRTRTADGVEGLRQYRTEFDEKLGTFTDRPLKNWASHPADAYGHVGLAWRELAADARPKDPVAEMLKPRTINDLMEEFEQRDED